MGAKPISFFARTIRGIEWIAAAEIEQRCDAAVTDIRHREIRFQLNAVDTGLLQLGSVDDVFLTCGVLGELDHTRATLAALAKRLNAIGFAEVIAPLSDLRAIPKAPNFDVIASFLGRRNYNRYEIEDTVAGAICKQTGWKYAPQRENTPNRLDLSFRIHLSGQEATIGARLKNVPLHRRAYKTASRTGTLHPPLAFAMAMLANLAENHRLIDPCCGVGTILMESLKLKPGLCALGTDIDGESIHKANTIAKIANHGIQFLVADAGQLPFPDGRIDRIISNPPWGRTVGVRGSLEGARHSFFEEIKRIASPEARVVLLMDSSGAQEVARERGGFTLLLRAAVSLFGSWPEICVLGNVEKQTNPFSHDVSIFGPALNKYWQQWPGVSV